MKELAVVGSNQLIWVKHNFIMELFKQTPPVSTDPHVMIM